MRKRTQLLVESPGSEVRNGQWGLLRTIAVPATLVLLLVAGISAAPVAQAQTCSGTKTATWGAASVCVFDDRHGITVRTLDRREDGHCVQLWIGLRDSTGEFQGFSWVTTNCAENTWKSASDWVGANRYICSAVLARGSAEAFFGYLTIWRELASVPVDDECVW
jgi:hypothetical protein